MTIRVQGNTVINNSRQGTFTGVSITGTNGLNMNNRNIVGVNHIVINDPGVNEGIEWAGGNGWKIYESPNGMTNAAGNLQFTTGTTFRYRVDTAGNTFSSSSSRAPIFYDSNNTGYFMDPASTSRINVMDLEGTIRHNGDTNTYMQFHAADQWRVVTGGSERLEVNNTATKGIRIDATSQMRSPIYYDSNNTSYYMDPASTSYVAFLGRRAHQTGHLVGSYNSVGANSTNSNPIYTIGSNYNPASTTLGNMY